LLQNPYDNTHLTLGGYCRTGFRSYFWGLLLQCHFWRKSIKKCDRESAHRQTDRQTHAQRQTEFTICSMIHATAVEQTTSCTTKSTTNLQQLKQVEFKLYHIPLIPIQATHRHLWTCCFTERLHPCISRPSRWPFMESYPHHG